MTLIIEWVIQPPRPERPEVCLGVLLGAEGFGAEGRVLPPPRDGLGEAWFRDGLSNPPERPELPLDSRLGRLGRLVRVDGRGSVSGAGDCRP